MFDIGSAGPRNEDIAGQAPPTSSQALDTGRLGVRARGPSGIGWPRS